MADAYMKSPMKVRRNIEIEIEISENDIFNWLTQCDDPEVLERLAGTCRRYAQGLRNPDKDDFRSRA